MLIRDSARWLARHRYIERRLFEVVGGWSVSCDDAEVAALLAAQASHHAWHASLWEERLPVLHDLDAGAVSPPAALVAMLDAVAAPVELLERLTGLGRVVLPELLAAYTAAVAQCTPVADGPMLRALRLVIDDEQQDWRETAARLRVLVASGDEVERAATHQVRLERLLLAARD